MNKKLLILSLVMLFILPVSACASRTTPNAAANSADRFAGTWSGTLSFSDDANRREDVILTILPGCTAGDVCGASNNITVNCTWEITLETVDGDVVEYKFSKVLFGECPLTGHGTLTMQSDGTLLREHITPFFTASGVLTR
jgi:hypothetical protein